MGYAWNSDCYETPGAALEAFAKDVPTANPTGIMAFTAAPTINSTGLITWSISHRPLTTTTATTRTGTTQLLTCTYDSFRVDQLPDMMIIGLLLVAFFIGFRSGQVG